MHTIVIVCVIHARARESMRQLWLHCQEQLNFEELSKK
jgi:hypothetical protein